MKISKCIPFSFPTAVVTIFAMLPAITLAQSTDYLFQADSTYDFNAGFVGSQLFDLSGSFTLNENSSVATITDAIFVLTPITSSPLGTPLTTAGALTDLLESDVFTETTSTQTQTVYLSSFGLGFDAFSITVDNASAERLITLSGFGSPLLSSPDATDGVDFVFSATAVAVPEPTALPVCLLLASTFTTRRVRRNSVLEA